MKSSKLLFALIAAMIAIHAAAAAAATIDMDDPRRVVGREDDVRIDAQLVQDTVSPGAPIGVTYQIQNFTTHDIAIADKVAAASYDEDNLTVTLSIGAEVPPAGKLPHLVVIAAGEKKTFRAGATPTFKPTAIRTAVGIEPRYVQVKVSFLRDIEPFRDIVAQQPRASQALSDQQFDRWFESNDTIFLNTVPVRFAPRRTGSFAGAERSGSF